MSIRVELELDNGNFTTRMIHAGETVQQFRNNVNAGITSITRLNESSATFLGTIRDVTLTLGMARAAFETVRGVTTGWAGDIIKVNAEMERLKVLLAGMSRAADPMKDAADQVKYLRDFAKDAPFSLKALSDTFVKMKSTGIDPMQGALKGLVDGIAAFGGTDETLKRATIAIQQMAGKGVIQMEELRQQLGEAIPRAVELMARSMGVSTGDLIKIISKGTLDAKTSLQAFNMELERTFGGAAAEQMNTFNGMVSRMTTQLQNLALHMGDGGFFDAVKNQLRQLNEAVASEQFIDMAQKAGAMMKAFVEALASGIRTLIEYRNELTTIAEVMAVAFGGRMVVNSVLQLTSYVGNLAASARTTTIAFQAMGEQWQRINWGRQINQITGGANGFGMMAANAGRLRAVLPAVGVALATVSEFALPLTAVIMGLYFAFEYFRDKSEEAHDSLARFGATTKEQVESGQLYVKALNDRIQKLRELKAAQDSGQAEYNPFVDNALGSAESEQKKALENQAKIEESYQKNRTDAANKRLDAELSARLAKIKRGYDQEGIAQADAHTQALKDLQNANKDTTAENERYQKQRRDAQMASYQAERDAYESQLTQLAILNSQDDENTKAIFDQRQAYLLGKLADTAQKITTLQQMASKPVELAKSIDPAKLLEQAKAKLDKINESIADQKAELAGANGEYAKMVYAIESSMSKSNEMWRLNNPELAAFVDKLKEATKINEQLEQQLTGQKALSSDLSAVEAKLRQEYADALSHGDKDPLGQIAAKMKAGYYSGQTSIGRLSQLFNDVTKSAKDAGSAMSGAFDTNVKTKGEGMLSIVQQLGDAWNRVKSAATGIKIDTQPGGLPVYNGGGSFADNLIRRESGGDPNAKNSASTALGVGQFIESTWMAFLKDVHPEILQIGKDAALDARRDPTIARQAIEWYAAQNAGKLEQNNIPATDANLYLAHFLGPGGAIATLSKSSDTLLSSIKEISAARQSNPKVFQDLLTVGDLQAWSRSFMGSLSTASRVGGNTSALGTVLGGVQNESQAAAALRIQDLRDKLSSLKGDNNLQDWLKDIADKIKEAETNQDGLNKHVAAFRKLIMEGEFGANRDPDSERYKQLIDLAKKWDEADAKARDNQKIRARADAIHDRLPGDREALDARDEQIQRQLQDESKFKFSDSYYTKLKKTLQEIQALQMDIDNNPAHADRNKKDIDALNEDLQRSRDQEVAATIVSEQQKTIAVEQSLMTQDQAREDVHQRTLKRLQEELALYDKGSKMYALIEQTINRSTAAYNKSVLAASPIAKQMKEWSDVSNNLQKSAASWLNSSTDALATFVTTGKADFASLAASIQKDLAKLAINGLVGKGFNTMKGGTGKGAVGKAGGVAGTMSIGGQSFVAFHHSGGVAGGNAPMAMANLGMFTNAPRFHTGTGGLTLGGDEIPIIAKRGEQVDWPDNLARMYGGGGNQTTNQFNVNVNGGGGSKEQNTDLANQIVKGLHDQMRQVAAEELRTQMRPGGMIGPGGK